MNDQADTEASRPDTDENKPSGTATIAEAPGREPSGEGEEKGVDEAPLLASDAASKYRQRWQETQAAFVDDPRVAVRDADTLVAEVMQKIAETFAEERSGLEEQWSRGDEASTEDLRIALQRYRSFFDRLLSL
jgi:hypothetical protein